MPNYTVRKLIPVFAIAAVIGTGFAAYLFLNSSLGNDTYPSVTTQVRLQTLAGDATIADQHDYRLLFGSNVGLCKGDDTFIVNFFDVYVKAGNLTKDDFENQCLSLDYTIDYDMGIYEGDPNDEKRDDQFLDYYLDVKQVKGGKQKDVVPSEKNHINYYFWDDVSPRIDNDTGATKESSFHEVVNFSIEYRVHNEVTSAPSTKGELKTLNDNLAKDKFNITFSLAMVPLSDIVLEA